MPVEKCSKWSRSHDGWMSWQCTRPVKADGMCAQHLAGEKRSKAAQAKMDQKRRERQERAETAQQLVDEFAAHGVKVSRQFVGGYGRQLGSYSTWAVIIRADHLRELIERAEGK